MAKKKTTLDFVAVEYTDGLTSACNSFEIDPTDERVKILDSFKTIEEAQAAAEKHATENNLTYKF